MITLYYDNTSLQVQEDDSSFRYKAIMGDNSVTLKFSLKQSIDFPVGTYIIFENAQYTLTSPERWSRHGAENIEYTMVLEGVQSSLKKYKLRNQQDGRLKFGMNATPAEFLQLIIDNLNQSGRETGWTGVCNITAENKTIEFNHDFLSSALTSIAEAFETEYEITDAKVIRLGKVEYNKDTPLPLSHGKGNGFKPGSGRANSNDSRPVEVLYVQGGERNIDRSKYGASELHLPKSGRLTYEGIEYEADENGMFIKKANSTPVYGNEDSFDGSDIYPKRVGEVSSVIVKDEAKHFYDFTDSSIPAALDYNEQLIAGDTMTVIFQTGMLAGKEFEISKYDHASRRFEIVPQEIDGIAMPDDTWKPVAGDKYAIFGCTLPDSYINDAATQTGAEWDLFREAARYLYDNKDFKFTFTGELQGKWARENWVEGLAVASKLVIGGYVRFTDAYFAPDGVDIRIVGVKTFLSDPYAPTIEISNSIASASTFSSELRKPEAQEVRIEQAYRDSISFTKRRWRDANETMTMLEESLLANFTSRISPIAVNTMQMIVGDESLQFVFVDRKTAPQNVVAHTETWNNATKTFTMGAGILKHMTLGISEIAGEGTHALSDYKYWDIPSKDFSLASSGLEEKGYYLYAKCSKSGTTGTFVASETPIALEGVSGYYHFLVGILNSEYDGDRSYVPMYGFTEILPSRITTDKIVSGQGTTYWDLVQNILNLGGKLQFNTQESGAGNLLLKGTLVQTGSGEPVVISAHCGDYDATRIYQLGDTVTYTSGGVTSTYRYVNSVASSGHLPTDTTYWKVDAAGSGAAGADGYNQGTVILYKRSATPITAITWSNALYYKFSTNALETTPTGWSRSIPSGTDPVYATAASFASRQDRVKIEASQWAAPVEAFKNGTDGQDGQDGQDGTDGTNGSNGLNSATVMLYRRAASRPSKPSASLTYTFATGVLSGTLGAWSQQIPDSDGNPCWVTLATAVSSDATDTIPSSEWSQPKKMVEDGLPGGAGESGYNQATITLYKRSASPITAIDWSATLYFLFSTNSLESTPSGWSRNIPEGTDPIYATAASVSSRENRVAITANQWASPVEFVKNGTDGQDGQDGTNGLNTASVMLYKRSADSPAKPSGALTYTFATGVLSGTLGDWSQQIPDTDGNPCWVILATAISSGATDTIASSEWSSPKKLVEDGSDGQDGRGIVSTVVEYTVDSQGINIPESNWQAAIPSVSPGYYLWTRTTINYTSGNPSVSYSVSRSGVNGTDGTDGTDGTNGYSTKYLYKSQATQPNTPTGTNPSPSGWSTDPTPQQMSAYVGVVEYRGSWVKQTSGTYANWYKAPATADDASSRLSFFFETQTDNVYIKLDVAIACEADADFLLIGGADETPYYEDEDYGNYAEYITSEESGVIKTTQVSILVKRAGVHKIDFLFCKDSSVTNVDDVYVKYNSAYRVNKVWMSSCRVQDGVASNWTTPICLNGENGENAVAAAACVYRGEYNVNPYTGKSEVMTYWGLSARTDIVRYNNRYYRTNPCVGGSFSNIPPTNRAYWMDFGANFDSVATGFLFAEKAVLENAIVRELITNDTGARIQASGISLKMLDADGAIKLNIVGDELGSTPSASSYSFNGITLLSTYYTNQKVINGVSVETFVELKTFNVGGDTNAINISQIIIPVTVRVGDSLNGYCYYEVAASLYIDDREVSEDIVTNEFADGEKDVKTDNLSLSASNITLSKGDHTLKVKYRLNIYGSSDWSSDADFNINIYTSAGTLSVTYPIQKVEIGSNGFRAMFSGEQYAQFLSVNGVPVFMIRNGNYCLRVASNGVQKSTNGGTSWTNL